MRKGRRTGGEGAVPCGVREAPSMYEMLVPIELIMIACARGGLDSASSD